ncbi:multicopper oxidase domain-containing protein [Hamadaea flava]|uniref:Multicopper oxidase domain-containing protein n=1 Tax=Hamadaea flava TaxID=1742688 RepID=A0ABV8LV55_9ACTN
MDVRSGPPRRKPGVRTGTSHRTGPGHGRGQGPDRLRLTACAADQCPLGREDPVGIHLGHTVKLLLDADNPGRWMLHCHNT